MKYRVNEIFGSVQAEGVDSGRAAIFVRFSGCNLSCPWCDTDHMDGIEMTAGEIKESVFRLDPKRRRLIVLTGGEPTLQLREDEPLLQEWACAMETNGEIPPPAWFTGHVCVSPKREIPPARLYFADAIKCVMGTLPVSYLSLLESEMGFFKSLFVQPLEREGKYNINECLAWVSAHPRWRISVQWHKLLEVK